MAEKLSADDVRAVAALARIAIDDAEVERLRDELAAVLEYAAELDGLDLDGVEPTFHPGGKGGVPLRKDVVAPSLDRSVVLSAAPVHDDEAFLVPRVVGDGAGDDR